MTQKAKKRILFTAAFLIVLYLLTGFVSAFVMANFFIKRPEAGWPDPIIHLKGTRAPFEKILHESRTWLYEKNPEQINITSSDGLKLAALLLSVPDQKNSKGTVLFMHGYHSLSSFEFSGFYQFFYKNGYNIVLADQRSHGNSEGQYLSFGIKERYDCRDWITFINKHFSTEKPVYLCGVSMGSSTVLMTLGFKLPSNVKGVIADCGYTSPSDIVKVCLNRDYHLPAPLFMPFLDGFLKLNFGYSLYDYSVAEGLKNNTIPVLFIHGTNDKLVPFYMGKENFENCSAPKRFLQTDAEHAVSFLHNTKEYTKAVTEFLSFCKNQ
ncbi:MAG: lysophospholipase [Treponema sp.]|nr:lysophospholipase [Treponema sp.]